jgi:hypothetical protein
VPDGHPLLRGERLFRELLDASPDAMVITDRSGRIEVVNRQAVTMFGYTAEELAGSPVEELVPEGPTAVQPTAEESGRELEARRKDGTTFPCEVSLSPLVSDDAPLVIATIRDITKRHQLEEQFQQAQKLEAIGRLAGGIAHDFNNRLTAILGYADMALAQLNPSHPLWRDLQEIKTAAHRSSTLTRQLLAFSRRQVLRVEAVSLNDVVRQTDRLLERVIGEQITRELKLDEAVPAIKADTGQLEQILTNLAVNAKDAMPDGGCLTIETHAADMTRHHPDARPGMADGPYAVLSVTDSGHGMTRTVRDKIFEPFYTTKAPGEGTGLGLASVYGIVKQLKGHVGVSSEPGRGSTFRLYFPATDEAVPAVRPSVPEAAAVGRERVLLVEDESGLRSLVFTILTRHGYRVIEADTAEAGLQLARRSDQPFDLILTDVVLPGLSGIEMVKTLQPLRATNVLYMTGYSDLVIEGRGPAESDPLIVKPFSAQELLRTVRNVLDGAA